MWKRYSDKNPPRIGESILVIGRDLSIHPKPIKYFERFQSIAKYEGNGNLILKETLYPWNIKITHWMPLPKYPEDRKINKFISWFKKLFWSLR